MMKVCVCVCACVCVCECILYTTSVLHQAIKALRHLVSVPRIYSVPPLQAATSVSLSISNTSSIVSYHGYNSGIYPCQLHQCG